MTVFLHGWWAPFRQVSGHSVLRDRYQWGNVFVEYLAQALWCRCCGLFAFRPLAAHACGPTMGSIDYKDPPECVDCTAKAFVNVDGHGFVCYLCLARYENEMHRLVLLNFLRRPCQLANVVLQNELVGHKVMEFVLGDGMSDCC